MNAASRLNRVSHSSSRRWPHWLEPLLGLYLKHLPLLGLSGLFGLICLYLLNQFSPTELQTPFLPNVYLPLQMVMFLALFFLACFLTLNTRRGYLIATATQMLIFLKLQRVVLTSQLVISLIGLFVIIELALSLFFFFVNHANVSQKPRFRHRSRHS